MKITNWYNGSTIFEDDGKAVKGTILAALKAGANLTYANLTGANLTGVSLRDANLRCASLTNADLTGADLTGADLRSADLRDANLRGANLTGADLTGASLRDANLTGADLRCADLTGANLTGANLTKKDVERIYQIRTILPAGDLIGWKKLSDGSICKLSIPAKAKRVGGMVGRKCRAEFAVVLKGEGVSRHDGKTVYKVGETIRPDKYDPNPLVECSNGIHFFITKQEAEDYTQ